MSYMTCMCTFIHMYVCHVCISCMYMSCMYVCHMYIHVCLYLGHIAVGTDLEEVKNLNEEKNYVSDDINLKYTYTQA